MNQPTIKEDVLVLMSEQRAAFIAMNVEPAFYRILVGFYDKVADWSKDMPPEEMVGMVGQFEAMLLDWQAKLSEQAWQAMEWTYKTAHQFDRWETTHQWVSDAIEEVRQRVHDCIMRCGGTALHEIHPEFNG